MSLSDTLTNTVGAADPTGILSAAGAAVGLVGTVLRTVPALKNATHAIKEHPSPNSGAAPLHRAQTAVPAEVAADPERGRRAYETVNFVLREFGSRICAAGLVDEHALSRALNSAAQHIDFNLFSGDANRLFASLAPKLGDTLLVNNVFTSIYFIGALTAELSRSLPNYKESYVPLGPRIVQQLFRTAIGEDAFRENLTSNLDAYKTLATTAGLLRPTDIGYSAFPGFPAFSPCRYSSRSFVDVRNNRSVYEKLMKHFDKYGFPQPVLARQAEVGKIKECRFVAGDAPSTAVEVERADKTIGESFGRFLHWLVCSADRLPAGQAVIAYYDQHIELIKWIGQRMGYCILSARTDLDWSGNHLQLDKRARAISDTWVILMPSEKAQATRRSSSAQWAQTHQNVVVRTNSVQSQRQQPERMPQASAESAPVHEEDLSSPGGTPSVPTQTSSTPAPATDQNLLVPKQSNAKTIDDRLDEVERDFNSILLPQCNSYLTMPATDQKSKYAEYHRLTQHIEKGLIIWLDGLPIPEHHPARNRRQAMIVHARQVLEALDRAPRPAAPASVNTHPPAVELIGSTPEAAVPISQVVLPNSPTPATTLPQAQPAPTISASPPPYSPASPPSASSSTTPSAFPFPEKPPSKPVVRRKAPPPPKKFIVGKALYDFEPDADNEEELAIKEGDDIEIVEKTAALEEEGWCRARVKGQKKIGLVPLEYLEIQQKAPGAPQGPAAVSAASPPSLAVPHSPPTGPFVQQSQGSHGTTSSAAAHPSLPSNTPAHSHSSPLQPHDQVPPPSANKMGKKLEVAGLGVATIGAAAGVATVFQGASSSSKSNSDGNQLANNSISNLQQADQTNQSMYAPNPAVSKSNQDDDTTQNNALNDISSAGVGNTASPSPLLELIPDPPFTNDNLYPSTSNIDLANTVNTDSTISTAEIQQSVSAPSMYTPVTPLPTFATPPSPVTATLADSYSPPASPVLVADDTPSTIYEISQVDTETIIDDNEETTFSFAQTDDIDSGYDV